MRALPRALRNAGWLLGGKSVGAVFSLVYLTLTARSLGIESFGVLATVLAYGQIVSNLASFQSWQTIVRYGAGHLARSRHAAVSRLIGFAVRIDFVASLMGACAAFALAAPCGQWLGWSGAEQQYAGLFGLSLIAAQRGVPTGILRLFDRFDLASLAECTLPAIRLVGAVGAWMHGGTVGSYLLAWAIAEIAATAAIWFAALRQLAGRGIALRLHGLAGVREENSGLWRFTLTTNLAASLGLVWQQMPVIVVGWIAGPASAGGYRLAAQLGTAFAKPITLFSRALFPELARLAAENEVGALRVLLRRVTILSTCGGVLIVFLIAITGGMLLELVGGSDFRFARTVLVLLSVASAIAVAGFGREPGLVALGQPGRALAVRGIAALLYIVAALVLVRAYGPVGAAVAAILCNAVLVLMLHGALMQALRRLPTVAAVASGS